jgi:hypothetical protein
MLSAEAFEALLESGALPDQSPDPSPDPPAAEPAG